MVDWFRDAPWWLVLAIGLGLNVVTTVSSAALWFVIEGRRDAADLVRPITERDIRLATSTTLVNALMVLPAWWLLREGQISVPSTTPSNLVVGTIYLLVGLETAMYLLHRAFHIGILYRWFHGLHHVDDERLSALSFFVMHPAEAAGFALVLLGLVWWHPVSIGAIAVFYTCNLVIGTAAHAPRDPNSEFTWWDRYLGGAWLHQGHHRQPDTNFGFFTHWWDWLLGTRE